MAGTPHPLIARLHAERKQRKLSRRNLIPITGLSFSTISKLEDGTHQPTLHTVQAFADALGYDVVLQRREAGR